MEEDKQVSREKSISRFIYHRLAPLRSDGCMTVR